MALTFDNDTAFHEAGHSIISYLISDIFKVEYVTIDLELSRSQDSTSLGGLKGSIIKDLNDITFRDHDAVILMCLAGMAADDINHSECNLDETFYDNSVWAEKMNSLKYERDRDLILPHLQRVVPCLAITQREYTISCQKLLHEIFCIQSITDILIGLRNKISGSANFTITGEELNFYLDSTALKGWKENEWPEIFNSRILRLKRVDEISEINNINDKSNKADKSFFKRIINWFKRS